MATESSHDESSPFVDAATRRLDRREALLLRALDLLDLAARKHLAVTTSFHSTLAALREDAMRELGR